MTALPDIFGAIKTAEIPDPAAGAQVTIQPPAAERWQIYSITARLVTNAGGGNRYFYWDLRATTLRPLCIRNVAVQAGGLTYDYSWNHCTRLMATVPSWNPLAVAMFSHLPYPMHVDHTTFLRSNIVNMNFADQISDVAVYYELWII